MIHRVASWLAILILCAVPALAHAGAEATHRLVCTAAPATPSTTDIDCADWNAPHVFGGAGAVEGAIPYYDPSEATRLNWAAELLYDAATFSLRLGGGAVGTSGRRVLSLGCGNTTAPASSPADTVQLWCLDTAGPGTGTLQVLSESGSVFTIGTLNGIGVGGASIGTGYGVYDAGVGGGSVLVPGSLQTTGGFSLFTSGAVRLTVDTTGNTGLNTATFGNSAAGTVAVKSATACGTTYPADQIELCVKDRNGAGTAALFIQSEEGQSGSIGRFVAARSTTEATTTTAAVDLHTLAVTIPVTDGFVIRGSWRKTSGASATASLGLKINTVAIVPNTAITGATNNTENGFFEIIVWNRATSYLRSLRGTAQNNVAATTTTLFATADMTATTITDLRITGVTGSSSVTLGVRDVVVERIAGY